MVEVLKVLSDRKLLSNSWNFFENLFKEMTTNSELTRTTTLLDKEIKFSNFPTGKEIYEKLEMKKM